MYVETAHPFDKLKLISIQMKILKNGLIKKTKNKLLIFLKNLHIFRQNLLIIFFLNFSEF